MEAVSSNAPGGTTYDADAPGSGFAFWPTQPCHIHTGMHSAPASVQHMALARLEWFSSYLSVTCLLKTEGKDLIFPLDLVPSFLCILRKNAHLHLHFQGLQEGGGGRISLPRSQQFCLKPRLMLAKFCLSFFFFVFILVSLGSLAKLEFIHLSGRKIH